MPAPQFLRCFSAQPDAHAVLPFTVPGRKLDKLLAKVRAFGADTGAAPLAGGEVELPSFGRVVVVAKCRQLPPAEELEAYLAQRRTDVQTASASAAAAAAEAAVAQWLAAAGASARENVTQPPSDAVSSAAMCAPASIKTELAPAKVAEGTGEETSAEAGGNDDSGLLAAWRNYVHSSQKATVDDVTKVTAALGLIVPQLGCECRTHLAIH